MNIKNYGSTEQEKLQNRFTALITTSMNRARIDYLRKEKSRTRHIYDMETEKLALISDDTDFVSMLYDSYSITYALKQLDERECYVLLARVLEEKTFEEIADKLGLKYKGVTAIYYRVIFKLKNILGGN